VFSIGEGKPGWLRAVTCGSPGIVQREYRFTCFQLGVRLAKARNRAGLEDAGMPIH
jgi:hypothetical protein